ncbi:hypothetical protein [Streptomyces sp. NK15101]|uniref:hypothetical protein n=1 Tax=Streptomyces sp. NK15101 TaxID=2873261 RepID=UPI001CEC294B|nr:hypothetical protein [Streptomyces sp. NK15101]
MRTRITRGLSAVLAVSALSLTAACGGSDGTEKDGADKPAAGGSASASAAPTSQAPAAAPLTAAQMKAAALEVKDLPSGWKAKKGEDDKTVYKADKAECQPLAAMMSAGIEGATQGASVDFVIGDNASELSQEVATFPAGAGAADYTKKIAAALDGCAGFSVEVEGQKMKVESKRLTAPQGAEEAIAFGMTLEVAPGIKIAPDLVVARQGAGVFRMLHLADAAAAKKDFDGLAKAATDKFVEAARG